MVTIEVDDDVYNKLKTLAEPFIDTPNTVLKRLLFSESLLVNPQPRLIRTIDSTNKPSSETAYNMSSEAFAASFLKNKYGEKFRTRTPYRTMFESETRLIYFQNFNKAGTANLWYRLSKGSLNALRTTKKIALVCFTNPSEKIIYEIPMKDIDIQAANANWKKDFFEVNIDPANSRWRELDWNIEGFLVTVNV